MVENVDLIEFEDPSVRDLINKTAEELQKKYNKQRNINEKFLNKKTPAKRVVSIVFDVCCWIFFLVAFVVCFSTINTTINGTTEDVIKYIVWSF